MFCNLYTIKKQEKGTFKTITAAFYLEIKKFLRKTKNPAVMLGFLQLRCNWLLTYSLIELSTLCFSPSGSSKQPARLTIINDIAKSTKTFFIKISSKGLNSFYFYLRPH